MCLIGVAAMIGGCRGSGEPRPADVGPAVQRGALPAYDAVANGYNARVAHMDRIEAQVASNVTAVNEKGEQIKSQVEGNLRVMLPASVSLRVDKVGKPVAINKFIGRRPLLAFGNSDGDLQMLQWTAAGSGVRFLGLVHHTDADREWAYDRESHIGTLDKALDEANAKRWTVVNMKDDWKSIFSTPSGR